ncbi:MAG TPA: TetR/AcrR family transcriptional regulator [Rugosimonospora sp.]|nr:TetR/AcrR family transcriptional regulator [Rugosimonospora sp.]
MASRTVAKVPGVPDTRRRLVDVALQLFTRHSFAGTSLQMIADEMGITKAAVYHHFHTREELLTAVVEPLRVQLVGIIETAETLRTPHARAEHLLTGYVELAVRNRALISVLSSDPSVIEMLRAHPELSGLVDRQIKLLADVHPGPAGLVHAAVVFAGVAGAVRGELFDLPDEPLRQYILEAGRRVLGLRAPRRAP